MRHAISLRAVRHFAPLVVLSATAAFGFAANPPGLTISNEIAPAGGWAQIKIYAAKPMAIAGGTVVLNLSAEAFGTGAMVGLFGANGDAGGSRPRWARNSSCSSRRRRAASGNWQDCR